VATDNGSLQLPSFIGEAKAGIYPQMLPAQSATGQLGIHPENK